MTASKACYGAAARLWEAREAEAAAPWTCHCGLHLGYLLPRAAPSRCRGGRVHRGVRKPRRVAATWVGAAHRGAADSPAHLARSFARGTLGASVLVDAQVGRRAVAEHVFGVGQAAGVRGDRQGALARAALVLSLIHISEPTRRTPISYAVFCLK